MKKTWIVGSLLLLIFMMSGCGTKTPMDQYYYDQIVPLKLEDNLNDVTTRMQGVKKKIEETPPQNEADWTQIEDELNQMISLLEAKQEELKALPITDAKVQEAHATLVKAYENMISGYELVLPSIRDLDATATTESEKDLKEATELITKWQEQINEK